MSTDFYDMVPGAIGSVGYTVSSRNATQEELSAMQNEISKSLFSSFLANYQFTRHMPNATTDPQVAFEQARARARRIAEENANTPIRRSVHVQVGQAESLELLSRIESTPGFMAWDDPHIIDMLRVS